MTSGERQSAVVLDAILVNITGEARRAERVISSASSAHLFAAREGRSPERGPRSGHRRTVGRPSYASYSIPNSDAGDT